MSPELLLLGLEVGSCRLLAETRAIEGPNNGQVSIHVRTGPEKWTKEWRAEEQKVSLIVTTYPSPAWNCEQISQRFRVT